jgi:hypothetical protein
VTIHLCGPPGRSGEQPAARLALLRAGVAEPPGSPPTLVRSYRTVSPSPVPGGPGHRRSSLCCPDPTGRPVLALASALLCGAPTFLDHPGVAAVTGPTHHRKVPVCQGPAPPAHGRSGRCAERHASGTARTGREAVPPPPPSLHPGAPRVRTADAARRHPASRPPVRPRHRRGGRGLPGALPAHPPLTHAAARDPSPATPTR